MITVQRQPLGKCRSAHEALNVLCAPFGNFAPTEAMCEVVTPEQMPEPYRKLLVHQRHMTLVLKEHHGHPVNLYVMGARRDGDFYSRKIFLTSGNTSNCVELGVVRIDLRCLRDLVRDEILDQRIPLGAVLMKHNVLRRIVCHWYLRFPKGSPVLAFLGQGNAGPFYGRIGTIYCNEQPAIELLEIATLWDSLPTIGRSPDHE